MRTMQQIIIGSRLDGDTIILTSLDGDLHIQAVSLLHILAKHYAAEIAQKSVEGILKDIATRSTLDWQSMTPENLDHVLDVWRTLVIDQFAPDAALAWRVSIHKAAAYVSAAIADDLVNRMANNPLNITKDVMVDMLNCWRDIVIKELRRPR